MLIQCPACGARARIPESKEGAKVRCGECSKVYVALPDEEPPVRRTRAQRPPRSNTGMIAGLSVGGVGLLVVLFFALRGGDDKPPPAAQAATIEEPESDLGDGLGWDSKLVQLAVRIHQGAADYDGSRVRGQLYGPGIHGWKGGDVDATTMDANALDEYALMPRARQGELLDEWIEGLLGGEDKALVAEWLPFDGEVIDRDDTDAIVRVAVRPRDPAGGVTKRWVEWGLHKDGAHWKAWRWVRWISPAELADARKRRGKGYEKVTLSDGSVVLEREPEPLGHLEGTPPELRARIDQQLATMVDLDLTTESSAALRVLIEIGRPAIPLLLNHLYENHLETEEQAIQANLVVQVLRRITGEYHGYEPMIADGSSVGTTEERRTSSVKQWFAWWYRKQASFVEKTIEDGLEGKIKLSDKERRWLEKQKD